MKNSFLMHFDASFSLLPFEVFRNSQITAGWRAANPRFLLFFPIALSELQHRATEQR